MSAAANSTGGHTPGPWRWEVRHMGIFAGHECVARIPDDMSGKNAELIVRAVNNHDALVAALRKVNEILTVPAAEYVPAIPDAWAVIDAALKAVSASPVGEGGGDMSDPVECGWCGGCGLLAGCFESSCSGADCDPEDAELCCSPSTCDVCKGTGTYVVIRELEDEDRDYRLHSNDYL